MSTVNTENYLSSCTARIERVLEQYLPKAIQPLRLHQAMRYAVLNGGKRLRPLLVYAAGETLGASLEALDTAACAVELIHAYSLVHDDLPAMDDDDVRRGQPTCHKAFDEATAILVGDALQSLAFAVLSSDDSFILPTARLQMIHTLTQASGFLGMVGGQAAELELNSQSLNLTQLETIHRLKTGALIRASVQLGAMAAGANTHQLGQLTHYADCLGLAFQIQDDVLDHATDKTLCSYSAVMGLAAAQKKIASLYQQALAQLLPLGPNAMPLLELANFIIRKEYR